MVEMKFKVSIKTDYEFEVSKKEIYVDGIKSNVSWKTEKLIDGHYKTTLVCYDYSDWDETTKISWIPTQVRESRKDETFSFVHDRKNPSIQFLGYWTMRCLKNVNNYSTNKWM